MILLDPGESNDGEEDEVGNDLKLNVTWVGAEVSTGKSSLRSKNNSKKVSTIKCIQQMSNSDFARFQMKGWFLGVGAELGEKPEVREH